MNSAAPVQPVYLADLYPPLICCYMCSYENLTLLYKNDTFRKIEFATWELLKQIKFTANKTRIDQFNKFQRRMQKKSDFILSLFKNTCTMICTACICEFCLLHQ